MGSGLLLCLGLEKPYREVKAVRLVGVVSHQNRIMQAATLSTGCWPSTLARREADYGRSARAACTKKRAKIIVGRLVVAQFLGRTRGIPDSWGALKMGQLTLRFISSMEHKISPLKMRSAGTSVSRREPINFRKQATQDAALKRLELPDRSQMRLRFLTMMENPQAAGTIDTQ